MLSHSACLVRKTSDKLLLLGGQAKPSGSHEYTISTNTWQALTNLPFTMDGGTCVSLTIKGTYIFKGIYNL